MLVLTRKSEETIVIADCVVIRVLGISKNRVRIGIEATEDISIKRGELKNDDEATHQQQPT